MFRLLAVPALVVTLLPATTFAQFGGGGGRGAGGMMRMQAGRMLGGSEPSWPLQRWQVKVETTSGKTVSGTLTLASVPVDCELGRYYIKPDNIKAVRFTSPNEQPVIVGPGGMQVRGAVAPQQGEEIDGSLVVKNWTVETDLGQLTLDPSGLKSVTFVKKLEPPATAAEPVKAEGKVEEKAEKK